MAEMGIRAVVGDNRQKRAEERIFCYDARVKGMTIRQIAALASTRFGYHVGSTKVHELLTEETEGRVRPHREAFIEFELDRLDRYLLALDTRVDAGDPKAIDTARKISESRRRLLGLDAPTRVDATMHETTQQDLELQEMLREAKARQSTEETALRKGNSEATQK